MNRPHQHRQRAGDAALRPMRNRALAMTEQQLPPIHGDVTMPAVRVNPPKLKRKGGAR